MTNNWLSEDTVLAIRQDSTDGMTPIEIARKYGIARQRVYNITAGTAYKYVGGPLRERRARIAPDATDEEIRVEGPRRLRARSRVTPDGCWRWEGKVSVKGYATLRHDGATHAAHRVAYLVFIGPIPYGYDVDHRCHNEDLTCFAGNDCLHRRCVNPEHLVAVPHGDNVRAGRSWAIHGTKTHCPQGHPYDAANTRRKPLPGGGFARVCRTCAREYLRRTRAAS
jgi:hypothetical protein